MVDILFLLWDSYRWERMSLAHPTDSQRPLWAKGFFTLLDPILSWQKVELTYRATETLKHTLFGLKQDSSWHDPASHAQSGQSQHKVFLRDVYVGQLWVQTHWEGRRKSTSSRGLVPGMVPCPHTNAQMHRAHQS